MISSTRTRRWKASLTALRRTSVTKAIPSSQTTAARSGNRRDSWRHRKKSPSSLQRIRWITESLQRKSIRSRARAVPQTTSVSSVKSLLHRAREALLAELEELRT